MFPVSSLEYCMTLHQPRQTSEWASGFQKKEKTNKTKKPKTKKKQKQEQKTVKISPALTCLPGLAEGRLYVKGLEMWFQQGIFVAILRKNGSVTSPRNMRGGANEQVDFGAHTLDGAYFLASTLFVQRQPYIFPVGRFPRGLWAPEGPDGRAGRLTHIPDDKSVSPLRSLPPAPHSGEGPVIEAVGISGGEKSRKPSRCGAGT